MKAIILKGTIFSQMTEEDFLDLCQDNRNLRIERDEFSNLVIYPPSASINNTRTSSLHLELYIWNQKNRGGKVFDASKGFRLLDGSTRFADAAWMKAERWENLPETAAEYFTPAPPDFVGQILRPSDDLQDMKKKMVTWMRNGVKLAWLIVPGEETTHIYHENGKMDLVKGFDNILTGDSILPDFAFQLIHLKV